MKSVSKMGPAAWVAPDLRVVGDGACTAAALVPKGPMAGLGILLGWARGEHGGGEAYVCRARRSIRTPEYCLCLGGGSAHLTHVTWEDLTFPTLARAGYSDTGYASTWQESAEAKLG